MAAKPKRPQGPRHYMDHPPKGTADDQTTAFAEVLKRLYVLEDKAWEGKVPLDTYCEARAICERHLPVTLVAIMRKRHG